MSKVSWGIAVAAVAVALVAGSFGRVFYRRAEVFEAKAKLALEREHVRQIEHDLLEDANKRLKVRLRAQRASVAVVDSISPPDTSCAPNIAARDAVIAPQDSVIGNQSGQINLLQASNDEMKRALQARPKLYPRIVGPSIGVGVFAGVVGVKDNGQPAYGVGVGVTVNVFSVWIL